MTEEALRQLSKEALIALILREQETVHAQTKRIEELVVRVQALEAKQEGLNRPAKTSENSSKPPSSGYKGNRPWSRRKKRRKGRRVIFVTDTKTMD